VGFEKDTVADEPRDWLADHIPERGSPPPMHQLMADLFRLQSWIVYRWEYCEDGFEVYVGRPRKEARCPAYLTLTRKVHDHERR